MKPSIRKAEQFNRLLQDVYSYSAEIQVLLSLAIWIFIGLILYGLYILGYGSVGLMPWISLLLLVNGLLSGPVVALIGAVVCCFLMSSISGFYDNQYSSVEFVYIALALLTSAAAGGGIKRLLTELHERLHQSETNHPGTGLPNAKAALKYLESLSTSEKEELDVLTVHLENLDKIREELGEDKADELMSEFAELLRSRLGEKAFVSQSSRRDLLGIRTRSFPDSQSVESLLENITRDLSLKYAGKEFAPNPAGKWQRHALSPGESNLQRWLEKVIELAVTGRERVAPPATEMVSEPRPEESRYFMGHSAACRNIQKGLEDGHIVVEYLPRLNMRSGCFSTLETTVLWRHPQRGELGLNEIILMLDEPMALHRLNLWLVEQVLEDVEEWFSQGREFSLSISGALSGRINISLIDRVIAGMKKFSAAAGWLSLEFSEMAMSQIGTKTIQSLRKVQLAGGEVIVSSYRGNELPQEKVLQLPINSVKFSPRVLEEVSTAEEKLGEFGALISSFQSRGLTVICDGIESSAVVRFLRQFHCDEIQGPYLSRSLSKRRIPWNRIKV